MRAGIHRERSVSEPSLQVFSSNFTRDRTRQTDLHYELGKDRLAHWIGAWGYEEVSFDLSILFVVTLIIIIVKICALLQHLIARCPINQMEYLWTVGLASGNVSL